MSTPSPVPRYKRGHPDILVPIEKINIWTDRLIPIKLGREDNEKRTPKLNTQLSEISFTVIILAFEYFCFVGLLAQPGYTKRMADPHSGEVLSQNFRLNSSPLNQEEDQLWPSSISLGLVDSVKKYDLGPPPPRTHSGNAQKNAFFPQEAVPKSLFPDIKLALEN